MDALSQAIESYWNVNSTDESKVFAANAIKLIYPDIVEAALVKNNPRLLTKENLKQMLYAAATVSLR